MSWQRIRQFACLGWGIQIDGRIGIVLVYGVPVLPLLDVRCKFVWIDR